MNKNEKMLPIGPLMIEHRLIERMVRLMDLELVKIKDTNEVDASFIDTAVDFLRTYADRCHHGKEEDILFRGLDKKPLSGEHRRVMEELIQEHVMGRNNVKKLIAAKEGYVGGNKAALNEIVSNMETLVKFYPEHIEKEDKHFFIPVMDYFDEQEKDKMLEECYEFDRKLIHEKYTKIVEGHEAIKNISEMPACDTTGTAEHARPSSENEPCKE
ncbi:MAG: hemerythrin domain-containing protein [Candidatus Omnitrophota bacterium]